MYFSMSELDATHFYNGETHFEGLTTKLCFYNQQDTLVCAKGF